ncbi:MAG: hypothetical protein WCZ86_07025 [Desulfurivibrionaceae bacterium]
MLHTIICQGVEVLPFALLKLRQFAAFATGGPCVIATQLFYFPINAN